MVTFSSARVFNDDWSNFVFPAFIFSAASIRASIIVSLLFSLRSYEPDPSIGRVRSLVGVRAPESPYHWWERSLGCISKPEVSTRGEGGSFRFWSRCTFFTVIINTWLSGPCMYTGLSPRRTCSLAAAIRILFTGGGEESKSLLFISSMDAYAFNRGN